MIIGAMQPYLFPYIGYFQLINHVDQFVILDDVNYIKRGYINRNKICLNGREHMITLPVLNASQNTIINQLTFTNEKKVLQSIGQTIEQAYCKTNQFEFCYPLINNVIHHHDREIHLLIKYSITTLLQYLGIQKKIIFSSDLNIEEKGQERIISIVKKLNGKSYVNPIGGMELYSKKQFEENNIELSFIQTDPAIRSFQSEGFTNHLSIIDLLMLNPKPVIKDLLNLKIIHNEK